MEASAKSQNTETERVSNIFLQYLLLQQKNDSTVL